MKYNINPDIEEIIAALLNSEFSPIKKLAMKRFMPFPKKIIFIPLKSEKQNYLDKFQYSIPVPIPKMLWL